MGKENKLSEGKKWMISLWSALLFLLIASPFMFKLTGSIFDKMGLRIQQNGCPNLVGVVIHAVVFAILIRVMMLVNLPGTGESFCYSFYKGFTGFANPGSMANCNSSQLFAIQKGCPECAKAATTCMRFPFNQDGKNTCINALQDCKQNCKNTQVKEAMDSCHIIGHRDYFPQGFCAPSRTCFEY